MTLTQLCDTAIQPCLSAHTAVPPTPMWVSNNSCGVSCSSSQQRQQLCEHRRSRGPLPYPGALQVMAQVMGAEAALMRVQFVSGTHAIASALYAVLRPGDEMLAVAGQ